MGNLFSTKQVNNWVHPSEADKGTTNYSMFDDIIIL
jgi:hypothetical protein